MSSPVPRPHPASITTSTIDLIGEDLLHNIFTRLPAISFASAACVNRTWNLVCDRVLCRPKLSSASSFNPSLQVAVEDVVNKVLSEPIRPHFAIASVGPSFDLQQAHQLITAKLGSTVPVITNDPSGVIGRDVITNEFKEIQWEITEEDDDPGVPLALSESANRAIMLIVGFLPGIKFIINLEQHQTTTMTTLLDDPLQKQFNNLQMEWDSIKQSISRSRNQSSTTISDDHHRLYQIYNTSPKEIMSLLQNDNSPVECDDDDYGTNGIFEKRDDCSENGKIIIGRRLFEEYEVDSDDDERMQSECLDMDEKSEVSTEFSCKGLDKYEGKYDKVCMDLSRCEVAERDGIVAVVNGGSSGRRGGFVGRWMICLVVMLLAFGIVVFKCSGEHEQILVPT